MKEKNIKKKKVHLEGLLDELHVQGVNGEVGFSSNQQYIIGQALKFVVRQSVKSNVRAFANIGLKALDTKLYSSGVENDKGSKG